MSRINMDDVDEVEDYIDRMNDHLDRCIAGGVKYSEVMARNPDFRKDLDKAMERQGELMQIYEAQKKRMEAKVADKSIVEEMDGIVKTRDPHKKNASKTMRTIICANALAYEEAEAEYRQRLGTQKKEHEEELVSLKRRFEEDQKGMADRLAQYEERGNKRHQQSSQREIREEQTRQSQPPTTRTAGGQVPLIEAFRPASNEAETRSMGVSQKFMDDFGYKKERLQFMPKRPATGSEAFASLVDVLGQNRDAWDDKSYSARGK